MLALKEFANFISLNVANLAATYDQLLVENSDGYAALSTDSRTVRARRLIKTVAEACESETSEPLRRFFDSRVAPTSPEPSKSELPSPLLEIECLGQTLTPVVTNLEAGKFLWQMLAEARATIFNSISFDSTPVSNLIVQPELPLSNDNTANQAPEASSFQQRNLLSTLIDNLPDYVYAKDAESRFILLNTATAHLLGASSVDEVVGKTDSDFFPSELARQFRADEQALMQSGQSLLNHEERLVDSATGQTRWNLTSKIPLRDDKGKVIGLIGINRDITARKQAEEAVHESQRMLQLVMDNVPQSIFWKSKNLVYLGCNRRFAADAGLDSPEEIIGKVDADLVWREQAELYNADDRRVMETNQAKLNFEEPQTTPSGERIWLQTSKVPLYDAQGNVIGILGMYGDITARKRGEEALQQAEADHRTLIQNLPIGLYRNTPGPQGRFLMANPAIAQIFGYDSVDEFMQVNVADLYVDPAERQVFAAKLLAEGYVTREELQLKRRDGKPLWGAVTARVVYDEPGEIAHFDGMIEDITERKQAEEALHESEERSAAIVRQASDGVVIVQANEVKFLNQALAEMLGYSVEEMMNTSLINYVAPESRSLVAARIKARLAGEDVPAIYETKLLRKDGTIIDAELSAGVIKYLGEDADLGLIRNITARKQAEAAARESQQRFQGLVETLSDWIWEVDQNGMYTYVSPKVRDLLGYEPEEVLGKTPFDFMLPEEAQRVAGVFGPLLAAQQPLVALENMNWHKDGHLVVFETSGVPFFDADGQFKGYRGTDRDVTERKQLEGQIQQALLRLTRQIEAITEVAQQISGTFTLNDLFQQVVDLMQTQFGYYHAQIYTMVEGEMALQAGTGDIGRRLKERGHQIPLSAEQSLVVRAVWEGAPVLVPDVSQEPTWLPNPLLLETKAELAVPITLGAEVLGVLDVQSDQVGGLNEEDRLLLVGLCGQIAIAIESRRVEAERVGLLAETERRARREQTIREITERMRAATSLEQLVKTTARELGQRLAAGHAVVELGMERETPDSTPAPSLSNNGY